MSERKQIAPLLYIQQPKMKNLTRNMQENFTSKTFRIDAGQNEQFRSNARLGESLLDVLDLEESENNEQTNVDSGKETLIFKESKTEEQLLKSKNEEYVTGKLPLEEHESRKPILFNDLTLDEKLVQLLRVTATAAKFRYLFLTNSRAYYGYIHSVNEDGISIYLSNGGKKIKLDTDSLLDIKIVGL